MVDYKPNTRTYEVSTNTTNNYLNMSAYTSYTSTTRVGSSPETYFNSLTTNLILAPLNRVPALIPTYLNTFSYKPNPSWYSSGIAVRNDRYRITSAWEGSTDIHLNGASIRLVIRRNEIGFPFLLSVLLRFTVSDYTFGICKLFFNIPKG
jgi:hypothetical protein